MTRAFTPGRKQMTPTIRITGAKVWLRLPVPSSPTTRFAGIGTSSSPKIRYPGEMPVLYADGHVKHMRFEQTFPSLAESQWDVR